MNKRPAASDLIHRLREARERTLALVADLDDDQMMGEELAIVNPLLWEIGHVAWFQERWARRHLHGEAPLNDQADALYDSMAVEHDTRWDLPLFSRVGTLSYMQEVLERVLERLETGGEPSDEAIYFHLLALFHEDMHAEAFAYTRQTHGYPPPGAGVYGPPQEAPGDAPRGDDVEIEGAAFELGARRELPFVFDNEKWAHPVTVEPFAMAREALTQGQFRAFVEDDGYARRELWSDAGWTWREERAATAPVYWRAEGDGWSRRVYDRWQPLEEDLPMLHVSWWEADAYCRWAGRRLPTEAEWELAAGGSGKKRLYPWGDEPDASRASVDGRCGATIAVGGAAAGDTPEGCRQMLGNVWEWTADDFLPYPGFVADPYKDYSQPWFKTHKVLRGGCWATRLHLLRTTWRNFYTPDRRDVWAGFRTCALG